MTVYLGIDPGLDGALAFLETGDALKKSSLVIFDMPTIWATAKSGKRKRHVDESKLCQLIYEREVAFAAVESVHSMPGQGVASMFTFGMGYGILKGVLAAFEIPRIFPTPQAWQKALKLSPGKDAGRVMALKLFPGVAGQFSLSKNNGRSDAALIAHYARLHGSAGE